MNAFSSGAYNMVIIECTTTNPSSWAEKIIRKAASSVICKHIWLLENAAFTLACNFIKKSIFLLLNLASQLIVVWEITTQLHLE